MLVDMRAVIRCMVVSSAFIARLPINPLHQHEYRLLVTDKGDLNPVSGNDYEAVSVSSGFEHLRVEEVSEFSQTKVII
jgi:hypothetical protein